MKMTCRLLFVALSVTSLTVWSSDPASAATATAVLLPGQLAITSAPATINFTPTSTTGETQTLATQFAIDVTDATGSKAGWNINAQMLGVARDDGTVLPIRQSSIISADVIPETGIAPTGLLMYPHTFQATGDTIFRAAPDSGVGKSRLVFGAELVVPASITDDSPLASALIVTIASGP